MKDMHYAQTSLKPHVPKFINGINDTNDINDINGIDYYM